MSQYEPFRHSSGPRNAKIMFVGEAWGETEAKVGLPFMGTAGQEFTRICRDAGIDRFNCLVTNVFADRPPSNNLDNWCVKKGDLPDDYTHAPLKPGKYLRPEFLPHVERLRQEILAVRPNVLVALGNTACWALFGSARISSIRGVAAWCQLVDGIKVIPTYHPAAVLRQWALRVVVVTDMMKIAREAEFPEIRRPDRWVTISPTMKEIIDWCTEPSYSLTIDIETAFRQIKMVGFARSPSDAIVIPFVDMTKPGRSFWPTREEELMAWGIVEGLLAKPCPKTFQNGLYDLQYLLRMGFKPVNCLDDTMLLHHSLYPEMQKGLGFLGSIYTNEASWKLMRNQETTKRDE